VKFVTVLVTGDQKLPEISGPNRAPKRRVALAPIPTTAGSGSTWRFEPTEFARRPGSLGEEVHAIQRLLDFNPVDLSEADILEIYEAAC
jgi:alcohol dehydrogenase class IV